MSEEKKIEKVTNTSEQHDYELDRQFVNSKEEFINLIFKLMDENDSIKWENETAYDYLQSLASWLEDCDGFYGDSDLNPDKPSWQLFADAIQAARMYE